MEMDSLSTCGTIIDHWNWGWIFTTTSQVQCHFHSYFSKSRNAVLGRLQRTCIIISHCTMRTLPWVWWYFLLGCDFGEDMVSCFPISFLRITSLKFCCYILWTSLSYMAAHPWTKHRFCSEFCASLAFDCRNLPPSTPQRIGVASSPLADHDAEQPVVRTDRSMSARYVHWNVVYSV